NVRPGGGGWISQQISTRLPPIGGFRTSGLAESLGGPTHPAPARLLSQHLHHVKKTWAIRNTAHRQPCRMNDSARPYLLLLGKIAQHVLDRFGIKGFARLQPLGVEPDQEGRIVLPSLLHTGLVIGGGILEEISGGFAQILRE